MNVDRDTGAGVTTLLGFNAPQHSWPHRIVLSPYPTRTSLRSCFRTGHEMRLCRGAGLFIRYALTAWLVLAMHAACAFDVTGNVVAPDGKPVPGARVWLCQDHTARHVETNEEGTFAFGSVAPRPVDLVAYKEGFSLGGQTAAVVGSGAVTLSLSEPATLTIHAKSESFEPIAGAFIRHICVSESFNVAVSDLVVDGFPPMRSDADGKLTIPALPKDGHVRFVLGHRDYADSPVAYLPVSDKEQTIVLYPGVKLRGRVTSEDGKGLPHVCVTAFRVGTGAQRVAAEALTDPDGYYHFTVVPDDYFIAAAHPDFAPARSIGITAGEDEKKNVADFVLQSPRVITGVLQYPDGKPCPGTPVSYWIEKDSCAQTLTQQDGRFELRTPRVDGSLRLVPPDGYETEHHGDIKIAGENPVQLTIGPIKLKALPIIEGTIVAQDGTPESHVLIASRGIEPPMWALPDDNGHFRIVLAQAPPERTAAFRVEHAERFSRADFQVSLDDAKPVEVKLEPFEPDLKGPDGPPGDNKFDGMLGQPAPEITCETWFNSSPLTLASLKGKAVVLLFWGGFDERSAGRSTIEELRALYVLLKNDPEIAFIGIHDGGKESDEVQRYVKDYGIEFPVGLDKEPFQTFGKYDIHYIPQIVLIDKHGVLRYVTVEGRLLELIKSLRREGA